MPYLPQSSLARPAFRKPRSKRSVEQSGARDLPLVDKDQARECLSKVDMCKSMDFAGMCLPVLRELADGTEATVNGLWLIMAIGRNAWGLEKSKCHSCLQEGQKRGCRNQDEASRPHLHPWEFSSKLHHYLLWVKLQLCHRMNSLPNVPFIKIPFSKSLSSDFLIIVGDYFEKQSIHCKLLNFTATVICNRQQFEKGGQKWRRRRQKWLKVMFSQKDWIGWEENQSTMKTGENSLGRKDLLQGRIKQHSDLSQTSSSTETKYLKFFYFFSMFWNGEWLWLIVFELLIASGKFLKWWVKKERCPVSVSSTAWKLNIGLSATAESSFYPYVLFKTLHKVTFKNALFNIYGPAFKLPHWNTQLCFQGNEANY